MTVLIFTALGLFLGLIIVFADKKFHVIEDGRIKDVAGILPGANCGACGFAGCTAFAEAIVKGEAKPNLCTPGGLSVAKRIAKYMGVDIGGSVAVTAKIHCKGGLAEAKNRAVYDGIVDCFAAILIGNGHKECEYGCIGFGSCVKACPFGAVFINENRVAQINYEKCIGCGVCVSACPRKLIEVSPESQKIFVACSNHDLGAKVKKYCSVGCTGCTLCTKAVSVAGAIVMDKFLPKLDYSTGENFIVASRKCPSHSFTDLVKVRPTVNINTKCIGCGKCAEVCPIDGAIEGKHGERYSVNKNICIGCGLCIPTCDIKAMGIWGALVYDSQHRSSQNQGHIS